MINDALRCIKHLSLFLQSNRATIVQAVNHIDILKYKLLAMKTENGTSLAKFLESYDEKHNKHYKCTQFVQNSSDLDKFSQMQCHFFSVAC